MVCMNYFQNRAAKVDLDSITQRTVLSVYFAGDCMCKTDMYPVEFIF